MDEENSTYYDTIVISGNSIKGLVTLGALQYTYDNYLLNKVKNYIGTSSGAMICYLLIIGYTPIEIMVYICTHQIMEKMQHFNIVAMIQGLGATSFNAIQEQLEKMTIDKIGDYLTLSELKNRFNKTLIIPTYNITEGKTEYLSHETYPNLPCITALHMSSNLPLIFENFKYNNNYYVDGGISDNFAIDLGDKIGNKILGFILSADEYAKIDSNKELDILDFIYKLMFIPVTQSITHKINNASDKCKIIKLNYTKLSFYNFKIGSKEKIELFSAGYKQTKEIFDM